MISFIRALLVLGFLFCFAYSCGHRAAVKAPKTVKLPHIPFEKINKDIKKDDSL